MYENGLVNKWMADSLGDWQRCVRQTGGHAADDLTVEDTLASFVLWALVMALAAAAFLAEVLLHAHSRKKSPPYPRPSRPAMVRRGVMLTRVGLNRRRVPRTIRHGHLQSV